MKFLKLILKIAVPTLAVTGFMNCNGYESMRLSVGKGALLNQFKDAKTFEQMSEYGGGPVSQIPLTYEKHKVSVDVDQVPQCNLGEWDILSAVVACKGQAPLLITAKDQEVSEKLVAKAAMDGSLSMQAIEQIILPKITTEVIGSTVDIFICLDSNKNGRCADEKVLDLNALSAQMAPGLVPMNGTMQPDPNFNPESYCAPLEKGAVIYHKFYKFKIGDQTTSGYISLGEYVSQAAQEVLNNHDSEVEMLPTSDGGSIENFPLKLAKATPNVCPPEVRTNGCFVKGTKIQVSKNETKEIENLRAGSPVLMADGRTQYISRIIAGPEVKPVLTFEMGAGHQITVTSEHPLVTNKGLRLAKDIRMGEELLGANGNYITILGIKENSYSDLVYNFEFRGERENDHLIVAAGIVSGDLFLQNKLSKEAAGEVRANQLSAK